MEIALLYFDGCPNWNVTAAHLVALAAEFPDLTINHHRVETTREAERVGFRGSPSILLDGVDAFASPEDPVGLSCRLYQTPDGPAGSPTLDQLRNVITKA